MLISGWLVICVCCIKVVILFKLSICLRVIGSMLNGYCNGWFVGLSRLGLILLVLLFIFLSVEFIFSMVFVFVWVFCVWVSSMVKSGWKLFVSECWYWVCVVIKVLNWFCVKGWKSYCCFSKICCYCLMNILICVVLVIIIDLKKEY